MSYRKYDKKAQKFYTYFAKIFIVVVVVSILALLAYLGLHLFKVIHPHEKSVVLTGSPVVYAAAITETQVQEESVEPIVEESSPEETFTVVLDAGHGGNDGGTFSGDIIEKNIDFSVVKQMKTLLEKEGINVLLTRDKDRYMSLEDRVYFANNTSADMFVSIHCNYFEEDSSVYGLECYYCEDSEGGEEYAEQLMESLEDNEEIRVRNAKESDYFVLKFTDMPAVLVEMGFLSNPKECEKLASAAYQEMLAEELVEGIVDILQEE